MYQADARRMQDSTSHRLTTTRDYASKDIDFETIAVLIIILKIEDWTFNIEVFLDPFFVSFTITSTSENITIPW